MPRKRQPIEDKQRESKEQAIRPRSKNRDSPDYWPTCCLCREYVERSGWCANCQCWPINITPIRWCDSGHHVKPTGWCASCQAYRLTELLPEPGVWHDTNYVPRLLTKDEVQRLSREVQAMLSVPGWPEKEVPLNRRFIPRRWKREPLKVVGHTPNGDEIVIPERCLAQDPADAVPF